MKEEKQGSWFLLCSIVIVVSLLSFYMAISRRYPYYFIWDMDFITALDTVAINSGLLPDHILHPGFGMYLILVLSSKIAYCLGNLSILNFRDVAVSLNPLNGMAELTDFIRFHSPVLAVSIVVILALALRLLSGRLKWTFLLFLAVLGTQESLIYHASMVRTELYSVFYWSCAIFAMAGAVKSSRYFAKTLLLFLTGLFLGLSFLTKAQSFLFLLILLILFFLNLSLFPGHQVKEGRGITRRGLQVMLVLSLFNLLVFLSLCIASYYSWNPKEYIAGVLNFFITPLTVISSLSFLILFLYQLNLYTSRRISPESFTQVSFLNIIASGFLISFMSHFFLYSHPLVSLQYLLRDFKLLFFGWFSNISEWFFAPDKFASYLRYNPLLVITNLLLTLLLALGYRLWFLRITKKQLALCLSISTLAALVNIFGTRPMLRDVIWSETALNFINLFYFVILIQRATRFRPLLLISCSALFLILFFMNLGRVCVMPKRIDANFNQYGWENDFWFRNAFYGDTQKYKEIMGGKYDQTMESAATAVSPDHQRIKIMVGSVFQNQSITHRNIGIIFEGFSAWVNDLDWKIAGFPAFLKYSPLVDNASLKTNKNAYFMKEHVCVPSEELDKMKKAPLDKKIVVLTRQDLRVFIFVHSQDAPNIINEYIARTPYTITLRKKGEVVELEGLEIKNYSEIPLDKIKQNFFFVVQNLYQGGR